MLDIKQEIKSINNTDAIKVSTLVYFILGLIIPLWLITLPLFWFLAYRSFKSNNGTLLIKKSETVNDIDAEQAKSKKFANLKYLKELLDQGVLTEDEYQTEKQKIISSI